MNTIKYYGQNVYTNGVHKITLDDIKKATMMDCTIKGAYFFKFSSDKGTVKSNYDIDTIKNRIGGLIVDVDLNGSQASVPIIGLERIAGFLDDTKASVEDLSSLKDKKTTAYLNQGIRLLGIGID